MEEIFKIIGLALTTIVASLIVKQTKPELAIFVGVAGSILIFLYIISLLEQVFNLFTYILDNTNIDSGMFAILMKIIGVGYITEFSANLCIDSGNTAIASKLQLGGKLVIFILAIPIITTLIDMLVGLLK